MERIYKSRIDWWLGVLMFLPVIGIAAGFWQGLFVEPDVLWIAIGAAVLMTFVYGGLVFPMRYMLDERGFRLRAGLLLRLSVPWERIITAYPSSNPLSSPALSLRRLCIEYRKPNGKQTYVLISPTDREAFLRDLEAYAGGTGSGSTQPSPPPHSQ